MPRYPGVQKKGNRWYWYIDYQGRRTWSRGFHSAEEAARDRTLKKSRLQAGDQVGAGAVTFREFADKYLRTHVSQFRRATFAIRERHLRMYLLPFLGTMRLQDIRPYHVEELQVGLLRKTSTNNVRQIMTTLRNALGRAETWELIVRSPAQRVDMPKSPKRVVKILTPEQFITLIDNCVNVRDRLILSLAAYAGLRIGEIFGLKWGDFSFENNTLALERQWSEKAVSPLKTEESRATIPLVGELALFAKQWKLQSGSKEWVFPALSGKNPMSRGNWLARTYTRLLRESSLPRVRIHSLRHSFASAMIDSGVSVPDLQSLMRHATYQVTMNTYRHVLPNQLETALKRYGDYIEAIRRKTRRKTVVPER